MKSPLARVASSTPVSSPESFVTATLSPQNPADITATDTSTPEADPTADDYRHARQFPSALKQHCQIYLEENLHHIALNVLERLHALGGTRSVPSSCELANNGTAYCPPPNQLALLNTIIVHPDFTTRPREDTWPSASSSSLVFLRSLLHNVGPVNARFKEAFRFGQGPRRSRSASPDDSDGDMMYGEPDVGVLSGRYGKYGVWRRGLDFFSVVGWAFNCSVVYPNRWNYWRQWLEFMLDVIEADLIERMRLDEANFKRQNGKDEVQNEYPLLRDSILAGYIEQRSGRTGGLKWIMKALFADGGKASSSLFQEVWRKEHKGVSKKPVNKRKRDQVNIEKGEFGGWLDDDSVYSSQASEPPTPQKRGTSSDKHEVKALEPSYVESIPLRQRLFVQLSYLCNYLPDPPFQLPDLYELYESLVKGLPLSIFTAFVSSTTSMLRVDSQISTLQEILSMLMPSSAVSPSRVDPVRYNANGTSPAILERCFLPYAANTIAAEDNAKVSILLEELIQLIWMDGTEQFSDSLHGVVMKGIQAREAKVKKKISGARGRCLVEAYAQDSDAEARSILADSAKRLELIVALIVAELEPSAQTGKRGSRNDLDYSEEDSIEMSFMSAQSS
ncbi:hypothetical protein BX600DRAFT_508977 [Xylariales sp. PMI_506]|nr:hypothetical protein BX600DRAFT_508977 [Xylariales sp. PMI_506]